MLKRRHSGFPMVNALGVEAGLARAKFRNLESHNQEFHQPYFPHAGNTTHALIYISYNTTSYISGTLCAFNLGALATIQPGRCKK